MEQPNRPYRFPAREILIPALKIGALTGKLVLLMCGTSRNLSYFHIFLIQVKSWWSEDHVSAILFVFGLLHIYHRTTKALLMFAQTLC